MNSTAKALLITGTALPISLLFVLFQPEIKPPLGNPPIDEKTITTEPKAKPESDGISDDEMFHELFGGNGERFQNARSLVDAYRTAHPGRSLTELAQDPALTPRLQTLMGEMMTQPELGSEFAEAMQLAMRVKGIKPSPGSNINFNMGDGFLKTESQADRYLGALLTNDAKALAQLFADVANEAAIEMALDPAAEKSSSGVSISEGPLPPGARIIPETPEQ